MLKNAIPRFPAANVQSTVAFYVEKLGFTALFDYGDYAAVQRDQFELHFWLCQDPYVAENTACRVNVENIDTLFEEFSRAGVIHPNGSLETKPWGSREFVILDNNGNGIFLVEG